MSWASWHAISEQRASDAHVAARSGDHTRAQRAFTLAAQAESEALSEIAPGKDRTLGITAVSAVSLWFKAGDVFAAQKLALQLLGRDDLPAFAAEQLRQLLQAIWTAEAMKNAGVSFLPGQVLVSVRGGRVITGGAPLDLIVEKVQTVQALFFRTIEFLKGLPHRVKGPPSLHIQEACRPWLFQAPPGSYQFSVAIQEPAQRDFFDRGLAPAHVAEHFMAILQAASEDPQERLAALVPAPDYQSTFLKLSRNLAPTGNNFDEVEIKAADDVHGIVFVPDTRKALTEALRASPTQSQVSGQSVKISGILRAVHLEKDWLEVMTVDGLLHITGVSDTVDDVIGPMVNKRVEVQAKRTKNKYTFVDIEAED